MLIKGHNIDHIVFGSSFTKDGFSGQRFDYLLANPPFGVEWKPAIEKEGETFGFDGRFKPLIKVAKDLGIEWHVLADGDQAALVRRDRLEDPRL